MKGIKTSIEISGRTDDYLSYLQETIPYVSSRMGAIEYIVEKASGIDGNYQKVVKHRLAKREKA